jgi:hypothetical protein
MKKKLFHEGIMKETEELNSQNETRWCYNIRKPFKPRIVTCKKTNGETVYDKHDILERWSQHFQELLERNKKITDNNEKGILRNK